MCDFKPGDEIVCVNPHPRPGKRWYPGSALEKDQVYTVTDTYVNELGSVAVLLKEVQNLNPLMERPGYAAHRFRKVQKRNDHLTIEAFSVIRENQYEEPKRAPAKKREKTA